MTFDRGTTVLLYTDGLVERRGQALDEGVAALRDLLVELSDVPLDELCDEVLDRMLPPEREDDVAVAAVRLHRQDGPDRPRRGRTALLRRWSEKPGGRWDGTTRLLGSHLASAG